MSPGTSTGCPMRWYFRGTSGWPGGEGTGGPLPVHAHRNLPAVHPMTLDLGDVVRDVVDEVHTQVVAGIAAEDALESGPRPVLVELPVAERQVSRRWHRAHAI